MLEAWYEYWPYIVGGIVVVGLVIFLLGGEEKQHIDISDVKKSPMRATLGRGRDPVDAILRNPFPYRYQAPPRSNLRRDNMLVLKGVGPLAASRLDTFNFTRYEQIAVWRREDYEDIADMLGQPVERIIEDRWVEQCKLLAAERYEEYEAEFGKINPEEMNRFKEEND